MKNIFNYFKKFIILSCYLILTLSLIGCYPNNINTNNNDSKVFNLGEKANIKDFKITISNVQEINLYEFPQIDKYENLYSVNVEIDNTLGKYTIINNKDNYRIFDNMNNEGNLIFLSDENTLSEEVQPGQKIEGKIFYQFSNKSKPSTIKIYIDDNNLITFNL